jgi:glycosyltransferase involved in cell wall biosynthesis
MDYRILIPTRNSGRWLPILLDRYFMKNISPYFILDARSTDNTEEILIKYGAEYKSFRPKFDIAEDGMINFGASLIKDKWIFRLDDDEFPSSDLLAWLSCFETNTTDEMISVSRRDIRIIDNEYFYQYWPTRWGAQGDFNLYNPQTRIFYPNNITFLNEVHTPGFVIDKRIKYLPNNLYFIHFNTVIRTPKERLKKIRTYVSYDLSSWKHVDESLPEIFPTKIFDLEKINTQDFQSFLANISNVSSNEQDVSELTSSEVNQAFIHTVDWLANAQKLSRHQILLYERTISSPLYLMPLSLIKILAKIFSVINYFYLNNTLKMFVMKLWEIFYVKKLIKKTRI